MLKFYSSIINFCYVCYSTSNFSDPLPIIIHSIATIQVRNLFQALNLNWGIVIMRYLVHCVLLQHYVHDSAI